MASLTKQQIIMIKNVVIKRSPREKYSANWQKIYQQFAIGEPDGAGKYLSFSGKDWDLLRDMVKQDSGFDVLNVDFNQTRTELSCQGHKEKFANIRPEANYVLVKLPSDYLPTKSVFDMVTSSRLSIRLSVDNLLHIIKQGNINQLVVVENLDIFDEFDHWPVDNILADTLAKAVIVYRGSGAHSPAGCKQLLYRLSQFEHPLHISAFVDLDPAGLQIAHLLKGCQYIIVPVLANLAAQQNQRPVPLLGVNDKDDFAKQWRQQKYLKRADLQQWRNLANWLQQNCISIKQQHILANQLTLTLTSRSSAAS
ncbi:DUF7281 domain-containing protein [Shewanella aestuarii]|uniref:DUF7281 domain-containing protein n=1 Tax=Shewanella aestuarii TaxID=1028752 RepID=A0A6G9QI32_9GAMM|nr:hypothetical protein [Shewanella aestuarii]QIR13541.1 hypothetical protein HBH39_02650 [Shewanella aestuarii]